MEKRIRRLDVFRKVPAEVSRASNLGGLVSILTIVLIGYLALRECGAYLRPEYEAKISSDKLFTHQEMTVNLDIEFHAFPCSLISLDLEDIMISHHPNIGSVQKWRLDSSGNFIQKRGYQLLRQPSPHQQMQAVVRSLQQREGCRLVGSFTVKEVPGNFHVSCHAYYNHYMQARLEGKAPQHLNMSHTIHQLYFGVEHHLERLAQLHPESQLHLLRNSSATDPGGQSFNYHLEVVPTWYLEGIFNFYTYQYTFYKHQFGSGQQPGVVHFNYHIGGLRVEVQPREQRLGMFLAHLCAIVGGAFALCQALFNLVFNMVPQHDYTLIN